MTGYYRIINGLAYTEDNILIHNLEISAKFIITVRGNIYTLNEFFKQIDANARVHVFKGYQPNRPTGIVYFSKAEYAAKFLERYKNCFFVAKKEFYVIPCQSFYQPDGEKFVKHIDALLEAKSSSTEMSSSYPNKSTNQEPLIFKLNDDCLEKICIRLNQLDQVNFALSCKRFWPILTLVSRSEYAVVNGQKFCYKRKLLKIKNFYQIVGPQIKILLLEQYNLDLDLHKYCFNVEKLTVIDIKNMKKLLQLIQHMPHLQEIQFYSTDIDNNLIQNLKSLKSFFISNSGHSAFTTNHLPRDLKKLSITYCHQISPTSLRNICMMLKNLVYLEIKEISTAWDTKDYKCIAENLVQLKVLKIDWSKGDVHCLTQLKYLKELEIRIQPKYISTNFAATFSEFVNDRLKIFKIIVCLGDLDTTKASLIAELRKLKFLSFWKCFIKNQRIFAILSGLKDMEELCLVKNHKLSFFYDGILEVLRNCLKLKQLEIYVHAEEQQPNEFLTEIVNLLQEQRYHRPHNLNIDIYMVPTSGGTTVRNFCIFKSKWKRWKIPKCSENLKINIICLD